VVPIQKLTRLRKKKAENRLLAQVTEKRKREVGLVVRQSSRPSQQSYVLQEFWYNHFELRNIAFDEKKFPMLF